MPLIYDTLDQKNPDHQGKIFVYDATSKPIDELRQVYDQSAADVIVLGTLTGHLVSAMDLAMQRFETRGGPFAETGFNETLTYIGIIRVIKSKVHEARRELREIGYACGASACEQGVLIWERNIKSGAAISVQS
ncbi:MAG: hypothetical protein Q9207_002788 [Kuettlingeria erythrocarpa]